jgi:hypothetical protein
MSKCGNPQHAATRGLNLPCIGCDPDARRLTEAELVAIDVCYLTDLNSSDDKVEAAARLLGMFKDQEVAEEAASILGFTS